MSRGAEPNSVVVALCTRRSSYLVLFAECSVSRGAVCAQVDVSRSWIYTCTYTGRHTIAAWEFRARARRPGGLARISNTCSRHIRKESQGRAMRAISRLLRLPCACARTLSGRCQRMAMRSPVTNGQHRSKMRSTLKTKVWIRGFNDPELDTAR